MGNDREGGMAVLPSAPLRARHSEGCLVVRNSELKRLEIPWGSGRTTLGAPGDWRCGWEYGCTILGTPRAWRYGE